MRKNHYRAAIVGMLLIMSQTQVSAAREKNGFALDNALVPVRDIRSGGPGRDGIPALSAPEFTSAGKADFLSGDDRVLGVSYAGITKAYPIGVMNYHEIVNDHFGEMPVTVTFCPLCGTGVVFAGTAGGQSRTFGVSGLLYNSDVLMYDHQSESLWSQIMGQAISGPAAGLTLEPLPARHTTWKKWRTLHPRTLVLVPPSRFGRNYRVDPYAGYADSQRIWFPVANKDRRYPNKSIVIGLALGDERKAYPFSELPADRNRINDRFAGRELTIVYDRDISAGHILDADGKELPSFTAFWFAWVAFHPDTEVYHKQ